MNETPRAAQSRSIEELLAEIDRLRGEVEALREARAVAPASGDAELEPTSNRRGMLRMAGVATAAAIAGGLAKASPARGG